MLRDSAARFFEREFVPHEEQWAKDGIMPREMWNRAGDGRPAVRQHSGGIRRRRRQFRPRNRHPVRAGQGQRAQPRQRGAQRHRRPLHPCLRLGGAEAPLAAEDGGRRSGRRHRHDRAGHRLRPPGRPDDRAHGRQPVCRQRPEDLHHQRPARRPGDRRRQDRPGREGARRLADRRRDRRRRGLQPRPQPREARPQGPGHVGAVLRRRQGADRQPARRRGGAGLLPADEPAAPGAADRRHRRLRGDGPRDRADDRLCQAAQGVRQAHPRFPEHPLQARRMQDRGAYRPGLRRQLPAAPPRRRISTSRPPRWSNGGAPRSRTR